MTNHCGFARPPAEAAGAGLADGQIPPVATRTSRRMRDDETSRLLWMKAERMTGVGLGSEVTP